MMLSASIYLAMSAIAAVPQAQQQTQEKQEQKRIIRERRFQLDDLQKITITINEKKFKTWVMDSPAKTAEGMMYLQDGDVKPDEAMIFVFPQPQILSFWMMNTYIPLDIAYLDSNRKILNTYTMRPHDTYSDYSSKGQAIYAIEFRSGTLKANGIKSGMVATFSEPVKAKGG